MEIKEESDDQYQAALQLLSYEGQIAWQMNLLFIGLNVGIGSMIVGSWSNLEKPYTLLGFFSIVGIIVNIAWLGTFKRNNKYYNFRMAQAREAEPKKWQLLRGRGYHFSKGHEITIKGKGLESGDIQHKLTRFELMASNKLAIELAIWLAIICFLVLSGISVWHFVDSLCK